MTMSSANTRLAPRFFRAVIMLISMSKCSQAVIALYCTVLASTSSPLCDFMSCCQVKGSVEGVCGRPVTVASALAMAISIKKGIKGN